jgi:hypothetical protein
MTSQETYYKSLSKSDIFANPQQYPWNCLLYYIQFTQSELLQSKTMIDIKSMIKHQHCLTCRFVREHFQQEVDNDDILTWDYVYSHVKIE